MRHGLWASPRIPRSRTLPNCHGSFPTRPTHSDSPESRTPACCIGPRPTAPICHPCVSIAERKIRLSRTTGGCTRSSQDSTLLTGMKSSRADTTGRTGRNMYAAHSPSARRFCSADLLLCRLRHWHAHYLWEVDVGLRLEFFRLHRIADIGKQELARLLELGMFLPRVAEGIRVVVGIALLQDGDVVDNVTFRPRPGHARRCAQQYLGRKNLRIHQDRDPLFQVG